MIWISTSTPGYVLVESGTRSAAVVFIFCCGKTRSRRPAKLKRPISDPIKRKQYMIHAADVVGTRRLCHVDRYVARGFVVRGTADSPVLLGVTTGPGGANGVSQSLSRFLPEAASLRHGKPVQDPSSRDSSGEQW